VPPVSPPVPVVPPVSPPVPVVPPVSPPTPVVPPVSPPTPVSPPVSPPTGCTDFGCVPTPGGPTRCGSGNCCQCEIDGCDLLICCAPCGGTVVGGSCDPC
jgi:hypothetical protein